MPCTSHQCNDNNNDYEVEIKRNMEHRTELKYEKLQRIVRLVENPLHENYGKDSGDCGNHNK